MKRKTGFLAALTAFSVVMAGAPAVATNGDAARESVSQTASDSRGDREQLREDRGKEIFAALFFAEGPLAAELAKLPEFSGMKDFQESRAAYGSQADGVGEFLRQVEVDHPGFFATFHDEMMSQNPFVVERAMEGATDIVASYVTAETISPQSPLWVIVALAAAHSIAAVSGAVLAVAVAAVYGAWLFWPNAAGKPASRTQIEMGLVRVIGVLDDYYR